MALRNKDNIVVGGNPKPDIEQMNRQLRILDERLDNMDSVITSLVQRVMHQPLTLEISCPKCGQIIQINITSNARLKS